MCTHTVGMKTTDNINVDYENAIWHSQKNIINLPICVKDYVQYYFLKSKEQTTWDSPKWSVKLTTTRGSLEWKIQGFKGFVP